MPTVVVNVKHDEAEIYCGRPSIFGNPFRLGRDGDRVQVITKYIDYFFDRLSKDQRFRKEIHSLKNKKIGCWCKPLLCHCDVIAEYLNNYVAL